VARVGKKKKRNRRSEVCHGLKTKGAPLAVRVSHRKKRSATESPVDGEKARQSQVKKLCSNDAAGEGKGGVATTPESAKRQPDEWTAQGAVAFLAGKKKAPKNHRGQTPNRWGPKGRSRK